MIERMIRSRQEPAKNQLDLPFVEPTLEERFSHLPEKERKPTITTEQERAALHRIFKGIAYGTKAREATEPLKAQERAWQVLLEIKQLTTTQLYDELMQMGIKFLPEGPAHSFEEIGFVRVHSAQKKLRNPISTQNSGENADDLQN